MTVFYKMVIETIRLPQNLFAHVSRVCSVRSYLISSIPNAAESTGDGQKRSWYDAAAKH